MDTNKLLLWLAPAVQEVDFEAVYRQELPRIYNFFRYRLGNDQGAEDLTSETFVKAWRNRDHYRRDLSAFSTWLFTIARRVAQDYYRRQPPAISLEEMPNLAAQDHLEDLVEQQANIDQLNILLSRLADRERELVALKYGAGLTNRAISRLTGLTESNVGVIIYRALHTLRSKWEVNDER